MAYYFFEEDISRSQVQELLYPWPATEPRDQRLLAQAALRLCLPLKRDATFRRCPSVSLPSHGRGIVELAASEQMSISLCAHQGIYAPV